MIPTHGCLVSSYTIYNAFSPWFFFCVQVRLYHIPTCVCVCVRVQSESCFYSLGWGFVHDMTASTIQWFSQWKRDVDEPPTPPTVAVRWFKERKWHRDSWWLTHSILSLLKQSLVRVEWTFPQRVTNGSVCTLVYFLKPDYTLNLCRPWDRTTSFLEEGKKNTKFQGWCLTRIEGYSLCLVHSSVYGSKCNVDHSFMT